MNTGYFKTSSRPVLLCLTLSLLGGTPVLSQTATTEARPSSAATAADREQPAASATGLDIPELTPAWGFADIHNHQFANLGFGGNFLVGKPFEEKDGIQAALLCCGEPGDDCASAECVWYRETHEECGTGDRIGDELGGSHHDPGGWPHFRGWPTWNSVTHQQVHYMWLKRAWQGGLRLMVMLAVNNEHLCDIIDGDLLDILELNGDNLYECFPDDGGGDMYAIALQVVEARALQSFIAATDGGWYRIAYTPQQARQIISDGDLAVILGVEASTLFACYNTPEGRARCSAPGYLEQQVTALYDMGVRHVFPIHKYDNAFGGSVIGGDGDEMNEANDDDDVNDYYFNLWECSSLGYRNTLDGTLGGWANLYFSYYPNIPRWGYCYENGRYCDSGLWCVAIDDDFNEVQSGPCVIPGTCFESEYEGELCSTCNLGVYRPDFDDFESGPVSCPDDIATECSVSGCQQAHCNALGLQPLGEQLIDLLMGKKMMIDIDHMSDRSRNATLGIVRDACYPVVASHCSFLELERHVGNANSMNEWRMDGRDVEDIRDLGGMVAPIIRQVKPNSHPPPDGGAAVTNLCETSDWRGECCGTARTFAQAYFYAVDKMSGGPVAMGTDFNGLSKHPRPRYNAEGAPFCPVVGGGYDEGSEVVYPFDTHSSLRHCESDADCPGEFCDLSTDVCRLAMEQLDQAVTGTRTFDVNKDGVAHMGMVADFIEEMRQVGVGRDRLKPLFLSADAYVSMWERVSGVARVVYVDSSVTGCGGGTKQSPYGTIARGLEALGDGATMVLEDGVYSERVLISEPVTLIARSSAEKAAP